MTKAALLPTPGDPFLLKFWFWLFENRWQEEIDKLYVCYNSRLEPEVVEFVKNFMTKNPKVEWLYFDHMIDHGKALKELLLICKEDLVMLVEDDGMIYKGGEITRCFNLIEQGKVDFVGSHRQSSSFNIADATKNKFDLFDHEVFFWPNFFFISRENLLKTDLDFGAKGFKRGDFIKELNWEVPDEDAAMDTFGWTSIQLRALGLRYELVDQWHSMAEDLMFFREKRRSWTEDNHWCHLGSLSSMMTNFLFDHNGYPLESRKSPHRPPAIDPFNIPQPPNQQDEGPKQDMESRVANLILAFRRVENQCDEIGEFRSEYAAALNRLTNSFGLRGGQIEDRIQAYKILYTMHI